MVNIDQEVEQTSEEKEHGGVEKGGKGLNSTRKTESVHAFCEESPNTSLLVGGIPRPGGLEISAYPLLHECRQECAGQAQHKAEEPERVHADSRG